MKIYGFTGPAKSGKDTFINLLANFLDIEILAFSDKLYREVSLAFFIQESLLRDHDKKEKVSSALTLSKCEDIHFVKFMENRDIGDDQHLSPRFVLQHWGEFRRSQNPDYFTEIVSKQIALAKKPFVLISGVRAPNEVELIKSLGGKIVHVERKSAAKVNAHKIEKPIPFEKGNLRIKNNSNLARLKMKAALFAFCANFSMGLHK